MLPYVIIIAVLYVILIVGGIATAFSAYTSASFSASINSSYVGFNVALVVITGIALLVVWILAMIKSFYYVFTQYIMIDSNNTLTGKQAAEKSRELMTGNRGKYFVFVLSFFGWAILVPFTFYVGMLWLIPYIQIATVIFYESLIGVNKNEVKEETAVIRETTITETPVATVVEETETVVIEPAEEEPKVEEVKTEEPENNDPIITDED